MYQKFYCILYTLKCKNNRLYGTMNILCGLTSSRIKKLKEIEKVFLYVANNSALRIECKMK